MAEQAPDRYYTTSSDNIFRNQPLERIFDAPFSGEEANRIRHLLDQPNSELKCPRCGTDLMSTAPAPEAEDRGAVFLLRCGGCRRFVVFDDLGERAAPGRRRTL